MALSEGRIFRGGETDFPWEREAIKFVEDELPDSDPHLIWPLHELLDPGSGRLYEIDVMVLARNALFLVEIKSHPGVLTGDQRDWTFTDESGRSRYIECPYATTNHKAKVLGSMLDRTMGGVRPYVEPLIFVSHETVQVRLSGGCPSWLVTRHDVRRTLVHGLPGSRGRIVNRPMMAKVRDAMRKLGLQPSKAKRIVGGYKLGDVLDEGDSYQEHRALSVTVEGDQARVRSYLVPRATSVERRQQLERAAQREAQILARLGQHPGILGYRTYQDDGPLGPAVLFEAFEGGVPLQVFLRGKPDLSFDDRLSLIQQVAEAVDHCHRAGFLHRNLSPASVLVRREREGEALQVRLHRFQAASHADRSSVGTRHVSQLAEDLDRLYQAPEVIRDPAKATEKSDVFSLGCLAYLVFTGQHPAATLAERKDKLVAQEGLRVAAIRGDLAELDAPIAWATEYFDTNRPDNALEWYEVYLLDALTRPDPAADEGLDPREASQGGVLDGDLEVVRVLGKGATAKVLKVRKGDTDYALKVPHDEGCGLRLQDEARVLGRLRHQHVVQLHEVQEISGQTCLLMEFAGDHSLADLLRSEGTLSLEKARRYGDDLLSAVQYLEEQDITHRDIKPGNLGFAAQAKKAVHLALYDFSLSAGEPEAVSSGTPEWRDPWLHLRGRWDPAADRYSAAAVLYQMVGGVRPDLAQDGPHRGMICVESERFDAAIRDRLAAFFKRAFAENVAQRHANAEEMRGAWIALFTQVPAASLDGEEPTPDAAALDKATPATMVEALPLSARARNALDRAGVVTVADLLLLPRNHLSAIRGVGHKVALEVVQIAEILRERISVDEAPPLVPDFPGPRLPLDAEELELDQPTRARLGDAGFHHSVDLAGTPAARLEHLVGEDAVEPIRQRLVALAEALPAEGSVEQWVHCLLAPASGRKTEAERRVRTLVGLDPLPKGIEDEAPSGARSITQVADAFGIATPLVHSSLQTMRQRWDGETCHEDLSLALLEILDDHGPVSTLVDASSYLARLRNNIDDPDESLRALATALVRTALELRPAPIHWRRIHGNVWVAENSTVLDTLASLSVAADELATSEPLPSSETVRARLLEIVAATSLASLPHDRLVTLAASASDRAASSARLELYPRDLQASRALQLSQSVLSTPGLKPDLVQQRVQARYPSAQALPGRPELDALMAVHGFQFDAQAGEYLRPGLSHATTTGTVLAPSRAASALPHQRVQRTPEALEAQSFQDALSRQVEKGRFCAVQVAADYAEEAASRLARALDIESRSLDHAVWEAMKAEAEGAGVDIQVLIDADRLGPGTQDWEQLTKLAHRAAAKVVDELLSQRQKPQLLVHPGVLARFDLDRVLLTLSEHAERGDGEAVVLLVPSHKDGLAPSINNHLPVPTESGGQRLWMPTSWLANAHRAAEA
jgi:serine/threonine protein kinase